MVAAKKQRFGDSVSVRQYMQDNLPDYAWQTVYEILTWLEQTDENISPNVVSALVCRLHKAGALERKLVMLPVSEQGQNRRKFMYRRKAC